MERWERGTGLAAHGVEWSEILAAVRLGTVVIQSVHLLRIR